uniref:Pyridine nucleotide-disulfide oxidoreductase domain-containing protein 1 n=1 Tax=Globodera rostochiensis TaxID=31243 RepID=A0A914I2D3_GLORO
MNEKQNLQADYVVVGGGVAGVCVVQELNDLLESEEVAGTSHHRIIFISGAEGFVKRVANQKPVGQVTMSFDVQSADPNSYFGASSRIRLVQDDVVSWQFDQKSVLTRAGLTIGYRKLAIATGASPKHTVPVHSKVLRLRDLQTVQQLQKQLRTARRVLIVGNGGIATELAFELKNVEVVWAIRHSSISATYFDIAAAKFFESKMFAGRQTADDQKAEVRSDRYTSVVIQHVDSVESTKNIDDKSLREHCGTALGPHWLAKLAQAHPDEQLARKVHVIGDVELVGLSEQRPPIGSDQCNLPAHFLSTLTDWQLWARLSDGRRLGCDLIIDASGVVPNSQLWKRNCPDLSIAEDCGILVNEQMMTNVEDVFAAGDVCTPSWGANYLHWKQIRLWTQARQMGLFCARCMLVENVLLDIAFELFSHVTSFFGYKIVLLGDFAGDRLTKPFENNYRITEGHEYVKVLTKDHHVHGAVLIGETDLEEAIENLILNQTDISQIEQQLLDPDIDLEDFFD